MSRDDAKSRKARSGLGGDVEGPRPDRKQAGSDRDQFQRHSDSIGRGDGRPVDVPPPLRREEVGAREQLTQRKGVCLMSSDNSAEQEPVEGCTVGLNASLHETHTHAAEVARNIRERLPGDIFPKEPRRPRIFAIITD